MSGSRKHYSSTRKIEILREHLENGISISELARRYSIHPNMIHNWKKQLFENAQEIFSQKQKGPLSSQRRKVEQLEERLKEKDSLIAEIITDNIRLKKKLNGES
jgi:transposase-like protein